MGTSYTRTKELLLTPPAVEPVSLKEAKRDIARVKTVINEKQKGEKKS